MQGFGVQTKNINDLIKQIEQEIAFIKKNLDKDIVQLNNKLVNCITDLNNLKKAFNDLKDYTEEEYNRVKGQIQGFDAEIEEIRNNLIQVDYRSVGGETVAVGLAPKKEYEQTHETHPIYAKYAEKDTQGRDIAGSINTLSSAIIDLSGKSVKYMGDRNINELNQLFNTLTTENINENYGVSGVTGWKEKLNNGTYSFLRVSNEDHVIWTGSKWKRYIDNEQTNAISIDFINNLKFGS